jgi:hypothetical protein
VTTRPHDPAELEAASKEDANAPDAARRKKPSWTWVFKEGTLTVDHLGTTVSLGRYATREFAAKAATLYIAEHSDEKASPAPRDPR